MTNPPEELSDAEKDVRRKEAMAKCALQLHEIKCKACGEVLHVKVILSCPKCGVLQ